MEPSRTARGSCRTRTAFLTWGAWRRRQFQETDGRRTKIKEKLGPLRLKPLTFFESRDTKETAQRAASWPFTTVQGKKTNWRWSGSGNGDPTDVNDLTPGVLPPGDVAPPPLYLATRISVSGSTSTTTAT